ncbi:MAG: DNA mismatch repair endonuclease MutL, partial [Haloarculaceae archaeon]
NTVVSGYALANPDVAVSLTHDGRELFATDGRGDLRSAVMSVYGREVASNMIPVEADEALPDGPLTRVHGLVSHPETTRASREYLSTFVNGRYVRATAPREAAVDAYGRQLASDRYPFAVLFLDHPPGEVDVNVHPRKLEVRFADEEGVRDQVRTAVRDALLEEGLVRSSAPRGRSAPAETEVTPSASEQGGGDAERPDQSEESADGEDTTSGRDAAAPDPEDATGTRPADAADDGGGGGTDTPAESPTAADARPADAGPDDAPAGTPATDRESTPTTTGSGVDSGDGEATNNRTRAAASGRKFEAPADQRTLTGDSVEREREFETLPPMRVLGQVHDTYVVAETPDGLVLVDQHAADERINYERLREQFHGEVTTQALAEPLELELTGREAALFDAHVDALAQLGFHAGREGRTLRVTTVPALLAGEEPGFVRDLLSEFVEGDPRETVEATADELLGDMACYPSITGNTSLTEGSVLDLLASLDDCENPYACPHGRPVLIELSTTEIEDRFERDYPGHG